MSKRELMKVYTVRHNATCKRTNYVITDDVKSACTHIIKATMEQYKDIPFFDSFDVNDELCLSNVNGGEHITAFERKYK